MRKPKMLAPKDAVTLDELCSLRTDHKDLANYWILADGDKVTLCQQRTGERPKASVSVPRADFNRLIAWYLRPQRTVNR